jgi:2-polyprenyl-3-methyl-5-hydroxy-6-metoxy-1,4-benzoquinol methylase
MACAAEAGRLTETEMTAPAANEGEPAPKHIEYYRGNQAYVQTLIEREVRLFSKYADALRAPQAGARVLDVGCGVGQVVGKLSSGGYEAWGVDVSEPNIEQARRHSPHCQLYDGSRLPFPDNHFAAVGSLNVLEHVEEPEAFITELVRVAQPGGTVVLSSPNFYRALGFRDYHPRMRGLRNKWRNWRRLHAKRQQIRSDPAAVRFDRMTPIVREPFSPDDDAIVATNALDMAFFLERAGCRIGCVQCTDRYVNPLVDRLLNCGPWRLLMFNAFVRATKHPQPR